MKGQRRGHRVGDVLALRVEDGGYRFGRIVKMGRSGPQGRFPGGILAYVYDVAADGPVPDLGALTPERLLVAPFFTMNWPWYKGYFRTVAHEELRAGQLLRQHCFFDPARGGYADENDTVILERAEPCGMFALADFAHFQDQLDEALAGRPVPAPYATG